MLSTDIQTVGKVVRGKINSNEVIKFTGVCTDTRLEVNGKLFIALEGPNFDAHSFIKQAEALGASACLLYTSPSPRDRTRSRMPSSA